MRYAALALLAMCVARQLLYATELTSFPVPPESQTWNEVKWSEYLAAQCGGETEHRCPDGTRVDILTETTAWEVEWATKWKESIGQAVLYSVHTEKRPGIWLLRQPGDDEDYLKCLAVVERLRGQGVEIALRNQKTY